MRKMLTLLAVLLSFAGLAQNKGRVSGTVQDGDHKTVESATIALIRIADSSIAKVAVADKTGKFEFEAIADGKYQVAITAVGHEKGYSESFEITAETNIVALKTIQLVPRDKALTGVVVTAKRPLVEQKIDRMVVNVDASPTNVGSSAMEVLEKSPGISVDKDGNISLKGKQGVMVLIDGRPTQLGGADLANLLRSMNAAQLDQIEIMTNPPAKYDAAGNAGIINIKTKKNKQFGYNGALTLGYGQGRYPKTNEALNFNYRQGKFNLFTNLSHYYNRRFNNLDIQRNFLNADTKEVLSNFDQQARMKSESNSVNAKVGLDYFAGKNTTVGVVFSGFVNPRTFQNQNQTNIFKNDVLVTDARAITNQKRSFRNISTNLNFRHVLDTTGKEITADLDYSGYRGRNNLTLSNYYFDAQGHESEKADTLYGRLPQQIEIVSGRVDYLQPLKKGARFEAGLKTSFVTTDNNAQYDTTHNGPVVRDLSRTSQFSYTENINAAYVNLSGNLSKKISVQVGLRLENTSSKGHTTGHKFDAARNEFLPADTTFKNNYTQLFPTAFLQYKISDKNSFGLNYGRRIRRPNYESMNPFIEYIDRYTFQMGNPNLKPQFSHNIELSHSFKGMLTTTLNYSTTNNIIQQVMEQNEATNETYVKQANIAKQRQYGLSVNAGIPLNKWWTSNLYVNVFNNRFDGIVNNYPVTFTGTTLVLNGSQQFKLDKKTSAEISGWFRTAGNEGVFVTKPMGQVSLGFSRQIMKGNGTLRLNVRDIFYTSRFQAKTRYGNVDAGFQEQGDSRVVNVGFTYRFNKGKMNGGPKRRTGSANDEQNRVGGGSN